MRTNKFFFLVGVVLTAILFGVIATHASEADQETIITFNAPVQIPGHVLPAGTYRIKLMDPNHPDVVQIFNSDGTRLDATLQTIRTERLDPTPGTAIVLAAPVSGGPEALLKWYYPGNTDGHEFLYSQHKEQQLSQDRQRTILAKDSAEAGD